MNLPKQENNINIKNKNNIFVNPEEYEKITKRHKEFLNQNKLYLKSPKNTKIYFKENKELKISDDMKKIVNLRIET